MASMVLVMHTSGSYTFAIIMAVVLRTLAASIVEGPLSTLKKRTIVAIGRNDP